MQTLLWSLLRSFVYVEVLALFILLLALVAGWSLHHVIDSPAFIAASQWKDALFVSLLGPLSLLTVNSLRWATELSQAVADATQADLLMAQRNLYISGAATLLWFAIWCAVHLVKKLDLLESELAAARHNLVVSAANSTAAAPPSPAGARGNGRREVAADGSSRLAVVVEAAVEAERTRKELAETRVNLERAMERLHRAELDLAAMRRQAEGTNRAFDELLREHQRLQESLREPWSGGGGGKKDD